MSRLVAVAAVALLAAVVVAPPAAAQANNTSCAAALATCLATLTPGSTCDPPLPVPPTEIVPPIPPAGYQLIRVRPDVAAFLDGAFTSLIVTDDAKRTVVLVDAPDSSPDSGAASAANNSAGTRLVAALGEVLGASVPSAVHLVYSHAHLDHLGAASRVAHHVASTFPAATLTVWGTPETARVVARSTTRRAVAPTRLVRPVGVTRIVVGGATVVDLCVVGGHTETDLAVHIPPAGTRPGVLHHVDVVFPGWAPPFTLAIAVDVGRFATVHWDLLALDWEVFSGGHLTRLGGRADVVASREYARDLLSAAAVAVTTVDGAALGAAGIGAVGDPSSPVYGNSWWAVDRVLRRLQRDACARALLRKWGCVLAGLDIMVLDNCYAAVTAIIVEA